jgi:hypothetical protein
VTLSPSPPTIQYANFAVAFDKITFHAFVRSAGFIATRHKRSGRYG